MPVLAVLHEGVLDGLQEVPRRRLGRVLIPVDDLDVAEVRVREDGDDLRGERESGGGEDGERLEGEIDGGQGAAASRRGAATNPPNSSLTLRPETL